MINFFNKSLKFRSSFFGMKSILLVFSVLIFFGSNAQVTFNVTNASSVNANDGQVVASVNPGSGNYTFYWEDLSTNLPAYGPINTSATTDTFFNPLSMH